MPRQNPCLTCGACCAFFRASFYWRETDENPEGTVPLELTEEVTPFLRAMRGTNRKEPRCIALEGEIGQAVRCGIYEKRSTSCRDFEVDFIDGKVVAGAEDYERCTRARTKWGLPPIEVDILRPAATVPLNRTEPTPKMETVDLGTVSALPPTRKRLGVLARSTRRKRIRRRFPGRGGASGPSPLPGS